MARDEADADPRYALAVMSPTSWAPYDYLKRFYARCCAFLGVDESHNTRGDNSDIARAIARGGYVKHRVFFLTEDHARAAGYRPCAVCLPALYASSKAEEASGESALAIQVSATRQYFRRHR